MTTRWANIEDDGALAALLGRVARRVPPSTVDALWIFPTRRSGATESTVIVVSQFDEDRQRRRVGTVHFLVTRDAHGRATVSDRREEHASAPPDAVERIIDGVLRRLEHEADTPPRRVGIEGDETAWQTLIENLADPAARPRAAVPRLPAADPADGEDAEALAGPVTD